MLYQPKLEQCVSSAAGGTPEHLTTGMVEICGSRAAVSVLLRSEEFTQYLSVSSAQQLHNIDALDAHRDRQQRTLKRNLSSGAFLGPCSVSGHPGSTGCCLPFMSSTSHSCSASTPAQACCAAWNYGCSQGLQLPLSDCFALND